MNRRATLQLRLQQTVEGLSVAAISYYLIGLLAYAVKAIKGINHEVTIGIAVPLVVILVAIVTRRARNRLDDV
jgi:uncharacterized membrane-anchored protein